MWRHWAPPLERSKLATISFCGKADMLCCSTFIYIIVYNKDVLYTKSRITDYLYKFYYNTEDIPDDNTKIDMYINGNFIRRYIKDTQ